MVGDARSDFSSTYALLLSLSTPIIDTWIRLAHDAAVNLITSVGRAFVCLSPAMHTFRNAEIRNLAGDSRSATSVKPKLSRKVKMPSRSLTMATVRTITRWTWNSFAIAASAHFLVFAIAFFFKADIQQLIEKVTTVEDIQTTAAMPTPVESDEQSELPALDPSEDEISAPDFMEEAPIELGDEIELPPEPEFYSTA